MEIKDWHYKVLLFMEIDSINTKFTDDRRNSSLEFGEIIAVNT